MFPVFAISVVDTGGKFTAGINDTSNTSGKSTPSVVDTGGAPGLVNISANFQTKCEMAQMLFSGSWRKMIHDKKNLKQKTWDTVPLRSPLQISVYSMFLFAERVASS